MNSLSLFPNVIQWERFFYHQSQTTTFKELLSGEKAFYNQPDYLEVTKRDFSQRKCLPVSYIWNTESKVMRIVKQIFSMIIPPLGIYHFLHALAGKISVLPASTPRLFGFPDNHALKSRNQIPLEEGEWKYKRLTVEADGYHIDAIVAGQASTFNNGRWTLASIGNRSFCEDTLRLKRDFKHILSEIKSNAIVFNYPGVGASSGLPSRKGMIKAYRAMLAFLEDQKNGIGAKEIIGYGHSIGGGVQGDALKEHRLKKEIKYVFIKDRTFADVMTVASWTAIRPLGLLITILGWNFDCVKSSKTLQAPEIIIQAARVENYQELSDSSSIMDDKRIPAKASLAKALLEDPNHSNKNKIIIGIKGGHSDPLPHPSFFAQKIESLLKV
jgi:hypothetical protein